MSDSKRYRELLDRYLEGLADEGELSELAEFIANNDAIASQFVEAARLDDLLSRSFSSQQQDDDITDLLASLGMVRETIDSDGQPNESPFGKAARAIHWRTHPGRFLSLALALTFAFVTAFFTIVWPRLGEEKVASGPAEKVTPAVAQLVRVVDAAWEGEAPSAGEALKKDRRLRLKSGLAQILFRDGASVILEGPAVFTTRTPGGGRLDLGKLIARVDAKKARGFTIVTPATTITDLGTEFAVSVDALGETEVVVFEGAVDASPSGDDGSIVETVRLTEGEGLRVAAGTSIVTRLSQVDYDRVRFPRMPLDRIDEKTRAGTVRVDFGRTAGVGYGDIPGSFRTNSKAAWNVIDLGVDKPSNSNGPLFENQLLTVFGEQSGLSLTVAPATGMRRHPEFDLGLPTPAVQHDYVFLRREDGHTTMTLTIAGLSPKQHCALRVFSVSNLSVFDESDSIMLLDSAIRNDVIRLDELRAGDDGKIVLLLKNRRGSADAGLSGVEIQPFGYHGQSNTNPSTEKTTAGVETEQDAL
jgi:hypothetical protein